MHCHAFVSPVSRTFIIIVHYRCAYVCLPTKTKHRFWCTRTQIWTCVVCVWESLSLTDVCISDSMLVVITQTLIALPFLVDNPNPRPQTLT